MLKKIEELFIVLQTITLPLDFKLALEGSLAHSLELE